jgi:hypothetical protein
MVNGISAIAFPELTAVPHPIMHTPATLGIADFACGLIAMLRHQAAIFVATVVQAFVAKAGDPCALVELFVHDPAVVVVIEGMATHAKLVATVLPLSHRLGNISQSCTPSWKTQRSIFASTIAF